MASLAVNSSTINKENAELEKFITDKQREIDMVVQRIEISSLLKEVDLEEIE